jgi:hypothetical protein
MEEPVQHGGHGGGVAEELAPVVDGTVRGDQRRRPLVAPHHDLQEILGGRVGQLRMPRSSTISSGTLITGAT